MQWMLRIRNKKSENSDFWEERDKIPEDSSKTKKWWRMFMRQFAAAPVHSMSHPWNSQ